MQQRIVYFVSESTGITASYLGKSLLSQFPDFDFDRRIVPYVNTIDMANELMQEWQELEQQGHPKPLVFATMADDAINQLLKQGHCHYYEFFNTFIAGLENDLATTALHRSGLSHGLNDQKFYDENMDIINFALNHDDAIKLEGLEKADVILIGVSRSGKTPTCLYLALHYGIRAANYPLTEDDMEQGDIPNILKEHQAKMVGLRIVAERLRDIREKRRPGTRYASMNTCQKEIRFADKMFQRYQFPVLNTTTSSIEELAAMIVNTLHLRSRKL